MFCCDCCDKTEADAVALDHDALMAAVPNASAGEEKDMEALMMSMLNDLSVEFTVEIEKKQGEALGMSLDPLDKVTLYVSNVKAGLVENYNCACDPQRKVVVGDYMVGVNGENWDAKKMGKALRENSKYAMTFRHAKEWKVVLCRHEASKKKDDSGMMTPRSNDGASVVSSSGSGSEWSASDAASDASSNVGSPRGERDRSSKLGAELEYNSRCCCLMFRKLRNKGPIHKWNKQNPEQAIKVRDRIVAVNGERGMSLHLLQLARAFKHQIELTVSRPHPLAAEMAQELDPEADRSTVAPGDGSPPPMLMLEAGRTSSEEEAVEKMWGAMGAKKKSQSLLFTQEKNV